MEMNAASITTQSVNPHPDPGIANSTQPKAEFKTDGPSQIEVAFLWLIAAVFFLTVVTHFQRYSAEVASYGDNYAYISAAQAIQHWDLQSNHTKQGWGLPYAIALLSTLHLSDQVSLLFISMASSLASVLLVRNLWGGWISAFFAILNFSWIQASFLGGSEPLFVLLLLISFWFSRKERWIPASVIAALATLTRPVGIFALFALALALFLRKDYRKLFFCTAAAALIGFLYLMPFWIALHDPLYQFHRYQHEDWQSGSLVTWPFYIIAVSYLYHRGPWTNVLLTGGWIGFSFVALCRMGAKLYRYRPVEHLNEQIFAVTYLIFLFCYNSLEWARWDFPRFVIPAIPLLLLSVYSWLPKSRYVVYPLCVVSSVLAACSAIGIKNVIAILS
jgi:Gpi18-like mannosyltransferase